MDRRRRFYRSGGTRIDKLEILISMNTASKMRGIKWQDFKDNPMRFVRGQEEIEVRRGDGSYFIVKHVSPFIEDRVDKKVSLKDLSKVRHRCHICGKSERVMWVVPYDASYSPGWYCYKCRRSRSILDIKRAKKFNKIV